MTGRLWVPRKQVVPLPDGFTPLDAVMLEPLGVAVDDPDKAIQVVNGLLPHLAPLLALSASSPFWRGEPTGLASSRQIVFSAFPRSGPPPRFRDYADYAAVVGQLERTGCIADYTHIWWDIRPHPKWGTIEIRICDAVTRVEDAVAIAAQAITGRYLGAADADGARAVTRRMERWARWKL